MELALFAMQKRRFVLEEDLILNKFLNEIIFFIAQRSVLMLTYRGRVDDL